MARYQIIDEAKADSYYAKIAELKNDSTINKDVIDLCLNVLVGLKRDCFLSHEETEAKWREVYFEGAYQGQGIDEWDNFKQSL